MPSADGPITTTIEDGVAVLRFDDGKANVLSTASIDALESRFIPSSSEWPG